MIEFKEIRAVSFSIDDVKEFLSFLDSLNEDLEGSNLPSSLDGRIVIDATTATTQRETYRLRGGRWEIRHNPGVVFLASRFSNVDAAPTPRSRALLLLCALETVARTVHLDEETGRRCAAWERRLLSYLPMREVVRMVPRGVFTACDHHDAEEVFGVAASNGGEILAVKSAGGWVNLSGEPVTPPRDAIVVEWG